MKTFKLLTSGLLSIGIFCSLNGCIKDDIIMDSIDPTIRITNPLDTVGLQSTYLFETEYLNNAGTVENVDLMWSSADASIISIDQNGLAKGEALGETMITVQTLTDPVVETTISVAVGATTVVTAATDRMATLNSTSIYTLGGEALLKNDNGTITLTLASDYFADNSLPGLFVYLSNSTNTNAGALEIGAVSVFNGTHSYTLPSGTDINAYQHVLYFCKPFGQRVGHGTFN